MSVIKAKLALFLFSVALSSIEMEAQIHSLDYQTPAYIDFEFSAVTVHEGQPAAVLNIYRSGDFRESTRLTFATEEDSAIEGKDYKGTGGTITFQPMEGVKQITVPLISDDEAESDETFKILLTNPSPNTLLRQDSITVTIQDEPRPIATPKLQIAAAGNGKVSLRWEGDPGYTLERNANAGFAPWEIVLCTPKVDGPRCEVVEETGGFVYLYRLRVR